MGGATVAEAAADVVVAQTEDDDEAGTADESRAEAADDDEAGTADDDEVERDDEAERDDAAVVFCEETRESLPFSIFTQSPVSHMAFWCWPK